MTRVRRPAACRASPTISSAGRPHIAAAQAASFGRPIAAAQEIALEHVVADAEPVEKDAVVPSLADECVRQTQHQGDVGSRPDRVPDRIDLRRQIVAQRTDQVELDTPVAGGAQLAAGNVPAGPAAADIVVLQRHAAKGEDDGALRDELVPADGVAGDGTLRPEDMRQDHGRRTRAVAADRPDIPAGKVQKAVDLALRVVKAAGARPAIGPAKDRARPMRGIHSPQFGGDEVERARPGDRHEFVAAPPIIGSRPILQPTAANHRARDPRRMRDGGRDVAEQRRGVGISRMRHDLDILVAEHDRERAPMRAVRQASVAEWERGDVHGARFRTYPYGSFAYDGPTNSPSQKFGRTGEGGCSPIPRIQHLALLLVVPAKSGNPGFRPVAKVHGGVFSGKRTLFAEDGQRSSSSRRRPGSIAR